MRWKAAWVLPLLSLAPEAVARAGDPRSDPAPSHTVVVLRAPSSDEVTTEASARVEGELGAAGFHVVVLPLASELARSEVETAGGELRPIGAFAIFVHPEAGGKVAEIWVSDRLRQMTVVQRARLTASDRERQSEILAVRAVELLKASLAEFWLEPSPSSSPATPPPTPPPPPPPPPPPRSMDTNPTPATKRAFGSGVGLGIGFGMIAGVKSIEPVWLPGLQIAYGWDSGVSLQIEVNGLGPPITLNAQGGSAKIEEQFGTVDVRKTWWPRWRVVPFATAGVGAQHIQASGTAAAASYAGATVNAWSPLTTLGLGAAIPVYSGLSFVAEARGALAWPPTSVVIAQGADAQVDAGHFGGPSLFVDASVLGVFP
jgi:hypothetical protein